MKAERTDSNARKRYTAVVCHFFAVQDKMGRENIIVYIRPMDFCQ